MNFFVVEIIEKAMYCFEEVCQLNDNLLLWIYNNVRKTETDGTKKISEVPNQSLNKTLVMHLASKNTCHIDQKQSWFLVKMQPKICNAQSKPDSAMLSMVSSTNAS